MDQDVFNIIPTRTLRQKNIRVLIIGEESSPYLVEMMNMFKGSFSVDLFDIARKKYAFPVKYVHSLEDKRYDFILYITANRTLQLIQESNKLKNHMHEALRALKSGGELVCQVSPSWLKSAYFQSLRNHIADNFNLAHIEAKESHVNINIQNTKLRKLAMHQADETMNIDVEQIRYESMFLLPNGPREMTALAQMKLMPCTLKDLRLTISSRAPKESGRVLKMPLIDPVHIENLLIRWPSPEHPSVIESQFVLPGGDYTLIQRPGKAVLLLKDQIPFYTRFAISDKFNYIHQNHRPLPRLVAIGLCAYINSTLVQENIKLIGSNFALEKIRYPNLLQLQWFGSRIKPSMLKNTGQIDALMGNLVQV